MSEQNLEDKKMLMIIYYHDVSLGEYNMQASKITIGTIIALLIFVAFGTVPLQSGYAQVSSQSNILVGPNAEVFGFVDIQSDGHSLNINGLANYLPPEGQVFEVWLLDAGYATSGYPLSIGQIKRDLTFSYDAYLVNPYTYTDMFVTIEPENDPDPKPATSITVSASPLNVPFGK
jgi:hypothetical protein